MKSILRRAAAGLLMFVVAGLFAFTTLRLFLHGREVSVPNLAGMSDTDAANAAKKLGLNLSVENRFYSAAVLPNHVLSQSPVAGSNVRRGWQVRVTESLGGQHVNVPDVTGQAERPAALSLRRLQLEVGSVAHLPAPAAAGVVLAQSPPPGTAGLNGPRVALLVAEEDVAPSTIAYVMPTLTGMTIANANVRLGSAGLHIGSAVDPAYAPPPAIVDPSAPAPDPAIPATVPPPPPVASSAIIAYQTPAAGHRVTRADIIRVTIARAPAPLLTPGLLP